MKQPQRLLNTGSPRAQQLLASLDEDVPPDPVGGPDRILRALDVAADSSGSIPVARPATTRRWVPIASLCGLVVACVSIFAISQRGGPSPTRQAEAVATPSVTSGERPFATEGTTATAPAAAETAARVDEVPSAVDVHALASAPAEGVHSPRPARSGARRDPTSAPATGPTNATQPSSTGEADELQLLERAQAAAARGQGEEALSLVARHRREFPRGRFGVEMSVIEIEALARAGRFDEAVARGERFLASHPGSPYTRRVEAVVRSRGQKELPR